MAKGITTKEPDPREVYGELIDRPHHISLRHMPMSLYDRAAQFAPFAALTGYDAMVKEEARFVGTKPELDETALELLNQKLSLIADVITDGITPCIAISYFVPDGIKDGGKTVTITEPIKKIDSVAREVVLLKKHEVSGTNITIFFDDILAISGDLVDYMDECIM